MYCCVCVQSVAHLGHSLLQLAPFHKIDNSLRFSSKAVHATTTSATQYLKIANLVIKEESIQFLKITVDKTFV